MRKITNYEIEIIHSQLKLGYGKCYKCYFYIENFFLDHAFSYRSKVYVSAVIMIIIIVSVMIMTVIIGCTRNDRRFEKTIKKNGKQQSGLLHSSQITRDLFLPIFKISSKLINRWHCYSVLLIWSFTSGFCCNKVQFKKTFANFVFRLCYIVSANGGCFENVILQFFTSQQCHLLMNFINNHEN